MITPHVHAPRAPAMPVVHTAPATPVGPEASEYNVLEYARLRSRFCYGLRDEEMDRTLFPSPPGSVYDPADACEIDAEAGVGIYERMLELHQNGVVAQFLAWALIVSALVDICLHRD